MYPTKMRPDKFQLTPPLPSRPLHFTGWSYDLDLKGCETATHPGNLYWLSYSSCNDRGHELVSLRRRILDQLVFPVGTRHRDQPRGESSHATLRSTQFLVTAS